MKHPENAKFPMGRIGSVCAREGTATMRSFLITSFLALVLANTSSLAQFQYSTDDNTATITGYKGTDVAPQIPDRVNQLLVVAIADGAFRNQSINSIGIPHTILRIGQRAFEGSKLTNVVIPDSVIDVGSRAFAGCRGLNSIHLGRALETIGDEAFAGTPIPFVTIPELVNRIGHGAFRECTNLTAIGVDARSRRFLDIQGVLFDIIDSALIKYPPARLQTHYTVPSFALRIREEAFADCGYLESITIPGTLADIEAKTFWGCSKLRNVQLNDGLTSIGHAAFVNCSGIVQLSIPASVNHIGEAALNGCSALERLDVPASSRFLQSIDGVLYDKVNNRLIRYPPARPGTHFDVPLGIRDFGYGAFGESAGLLTVSIPSTVTALSEGAFYSCASLREVKGMGGLVSIGPGAFNMCYNLKLVPLPNELIEIGVSAFGFCSSLPAIRLPDGLRKIPIGAFYSCSSITNIHIGAGIEEIGDYAFEDCLSLGTLTFGPNLKKTGIQVFSGCSSLTNIVLYGDAPLHASTWSADFSSSSAKPIVQYLPGRVGWGPMFSGLRTGMWRLSAPTIINAQLRSLAGKREFALRVSWATNGVVVIDSKTGLTDYLWRPVRTNAMTDGVFDFYDPIDKAPSSGFYRVRIK